MTVLSIIVFGLCLFFALLLVVVGLFELSGSSTAITIMCFIAAVLSISLGSSVLLSDIPDPLEYNPCESPAKDTLFKAECSTPTPTPSPSPTPIIAPQQQMSYADWQKQEDTRARAEQDRKAFEESNASECYVSAKSKYGEVYNSSNIWISKGRVLYHDKLLGSDIVTGQT